MTAVLIIIAVLAIVVLALVLTPAGHAIRTSSRRLRAGRPETGPARGHRPFRRPRGGSRGA
jgi:hypothetical protein